MEHSYTPITDAPDLEPFFGAMEAETAAAVLARLRGADEGIVRLARALDPPARYDDDNLSKARLGLFLHPTVSPVIDGCATSATTIDNVDGTVSHGAADLCFGIDAVRWADGGPRRWHVEVSVSVNCDRRRCVDEPHELLRLSGEAGSPLEAADLLASQIDRLYDWVASRSDPGWKVFRHSES